MKRSIKVPIKESGFSRRGFTSEDMVLSTPPDSRRAGLPAGRQAQDIRASYIRERPLRGKPPLYHLEMKFLF
ncbi:MAG: hypothetical protein DRI36_04825 [Caldiserica bacterium]|nr:MAG: hypothetical protein DRI36_04825 [Caldisericota bacterium]